MIGPGGDVGDDVTIVDVVKETRFPLHSVLEIVGASGCLCFELIAIVCVMEEFIEGETRIKVDDDGGIVTDETKSLFDVIFCESQTFGPSEE